MSNRRKITKPARRNPRLTPGVAVSDLVRIAIATDTERFPDLMPVQILAEDATRALSRVEVTNAMVLLALFARGFALRMPADERAELIGHLEQSLLVGERVAELELAAIKGGDPDVS